jgi:RNA polymerase subunit RPABC4/transcription elongation factor Spt4
MNSKIESLGFFPIKNYRRINMNQFLAKKQLLKKTVIYLPILFAVVFCVLTTRTYNFWDMRIHHYIISSSGYVGDVIVHFTPDLMLQVDEAIRFQLALIMCPSCGNPLKDQFNICPFCHTVLKRDCVSCGTMLDVNWTYCPFCGTKKA